MAIATNWGLLRSLFDITDIVLEQSHLRTLFDNIVSYGVMNLDFHKSRQKSITMVSYR